MRYDILNNILSIPHGLIFRDTRDGTSHFSVLNDRHGKCCKHTSVACGQFLGSMLPQYMALCVSELVSFSSSKQNFKPLLSKVGG